MSRAACPPYQSHGDEGSSSEHRSAREVIGVKVYTKPTAKKVDNSVIARIVS